MYDRGTLFACPRPTRIEIGYVEHRNMPSHRA